MDIKDTARSLDGAGVSAFLRSLPARPVLLGLGEARHFGVVFLKQAVFVRWGSLG
jgi:hypothetical protein